MSDQDNLREHAHPEKDHTNREHEKKKSVPTSWLSNVEGALAQTTTVIKKTYEDSEISKQIGDASDRTKQFLDDKGVTEKASRAIEATQEHLDTVSGAKLLRLVEERLELQMQYNDILATKLDEALKRIEHLEKCIGSAMKK